MIHLLLNLSKAENPNSEEPKRRATPARDGTVPEIMMSGIMLPPWVFIAPYGRQIDRIDMPLFLFQNTADIPASRLEHFLFFSGKKVKQLLLSAS
jgi:hypothetical protein